MKAFQEKAEEIKALFLSCNSDTEKYAKIIDLGKLLPSFKEEWKTEDALVAGCQSILYLHREVQDETIHFFASSEALISSGLAYLLIELYSGQTFETILNQPPIFFETIGLSTLLTPSRSNGFISLYKKIRNYALIALLEKKQADLALANQNLASTGDRL